MLKNGFNKLLMRVEGLVFFLKDVCFFFLRLELVLVKAEQLLKLDYRDTSSITKALGFDRKCEMEQAGSRQCLWTKKKMGIEGLALPQKMVSVWNYIYYQSPLRQRTFFQIKSPRSLLSFQ